MTLAPAWTFGFTPAPQQHCWLVDLPQASSDEATPLHRNPLVLHYFPENEIGKHMVQVIFTDLYVTIFTHGLHASNFSILLPFLLGL